MMILFEKNLGTVTYTLCSETPATPFVHTECRYFVKYRCIITSSNIAIRYSRLLNTKN